MSSAWTWEKTSLGICLQDSKRSFFFLYFSIQIFDAMNNFTLFGISGRTFLEDRFDFLRRPLLLRFLYESPCWGNIHLFLLFLACFKFGYSTNRLRLSRKARSLRSIRPIRVSCRGREIRVSSAHCSWQIFLVFVVESSFDYIFLKVVLNEEHEILFVNPESKALLWVSIVFILFVKPKPDAHKEFNEIHILWVETNKDFWAFFDLGKTKLEHLHDSSLFITCGSPNLRDVEFIDLDLHTSSSFSREHNDPNGDGELVGRQDGHL